MFSTLLTTALFASLAIQHALALTIDTPELTQCKDVKLNWEESKGPYNLIVVHGDDPCGDPIVDLGDHDGTSMTWKVNIPAGEQVQLSLMDANEEEGWSGIVTIKESDDKSCLPADEQKDDAPTPSTLVVTPTTVVPAATSNVPSAVGAAGNAGANPLNSNGAINLHHANTPVMVLTAIAAVISFSL